MAQVSSNAVFWIQGNPPPPLAIVLCPRGAVWLPRGLLAMRRAGVETVVSLLEVEEAGWLGLAEEGPVAEDIGNRGLFVPVHQDLTDEDIKKICQLLQ